MIRALCPDRNPPGGLDCAMHAWFLCKDRADFVTPAHAPALVIWFGDRENRKTRSRDNLGKDPAMRLTIEIIAAALLVCCISATSPAFPAGKPGRRPASLTFAFLLPPTPS